MEAALPLHGRKGSADGRKHKRTDAPHEEESASRAAQGLAVNNTEYLYDEIWFVSARYTLINLCTIA
jgi:hypothetical protein